MNEKDTEYLTYLPNLGDMYSDFKLTTPSSPIFIPRKHPVQSYADHKRAKQKRKNRRASR